MISRYLKESCVDCCLWREVSRSIWERETLLKWLWCDGWPTLERERELSSTLIVVWCGLGIWETLVVVFLTCDHMWASNIVIENNSLCEVGDGIKEVLPAMEPYLSKCHHLHIGDSPHFFGWQDDNCKNQFRLMQSMLCSPIVEVWNM
jgi:hypothetical protein